MTPARSLLVLRIAAVMALVGLALMVWGVLVRTPMPVILAMSVGQAIGCFSFLLFVIVVIVDIRGARLLDRPPP